MCFECAKQKFGFGTESNGVILESSSMFVNIAMFRERRVAQLFAASVFMSAHKLREPL